MRSSLLVPLVVLSSSTAFAAPARYTVVDLGTLGGRVTYARAIDDKGRIVGWSEDANGRQRAYKLDRPRALAPADVLPMPPADGQPGAPERALASGIADDGTIAGTTFDARGGEWAWLWMPDGRIVKGSTGTSAFSAITPSGDAVGYIYRWSNLASAMVKAPYIRKADGRTFTLSTYDGNSAANDAGGPTFVVGETRVSPSATPHGFMWGGGPVAIDLGLFGGPGPKRATASASTGRWAGTTGERYQGVAFTSSSVAQNTAVELPRPTGMARSEARAIDAEDRLVGWAATSPSPGSSIARAMYWHVGPANIEVVDLGTRVPAEYANRLMEASAINEEGVILIDALLPANRAVALLPVKLAIALPAKIETGAGNVEEFVVSNCEPGATVQLHKSTTAPNGRGLGNRPLGIRWDITSPEAFGGTAIADASGVARIRVTMTVEPNKPIWLQAVHRGNKSAVVAITPTQAPIMVPGVKVLPGAIGGPQLPPGTTPKLPLPSGGTIVPPLKK